MKKLLLSLLCFCALTKSNLSAQTWSQTGTGTGALLSTGEITEITRDANGNIYAVGDFKNINGKYYVAKWDGSSWTELGGLGSNTLGAYTALSNVAAFGNGIVYAASGGTNNIYKWDGTSWIDLGDPYPNSTIEHAEKIKTDHLGNVYVASNFSFNSHYIATLDKWNGTSWVNVWYVDENTPQRYGLINDFTVDNNGTIYLAGSLLDNNNQGQIGKIDGTNLVQVGNLNANYYVYDIISDASNNLYVTGSFTNANNKNYVAKWNGTAWNELGTGTASLRPNSLIHDIATDASGNVYAAGDFTDNNGKRYVAKWNGTAWSELGNLNADSSILSIVVSTDGNIYAAGTFTNATGKKYVARYGNPVSVPGIVQNDRLTIYPNPAKETITITNDKAAVKSISLYNALGIKVWMSSTGDITLPYTLNIDHLPAGTYFGGLETKSGFETIKFVKE